jgi:hypothetical protein
MAQIDRKINEHRFVFGSEYTHANNIRAFLRNSESIGNKTLMEGYAKSLISSNTVIMERLLGREDRLNSSERADVDNAARESMMLAEKYSKSEAPKFAKAIIENAKQWVSDLASDDRIEDAANAIRKGLYPAEKYGKPEDVRLFAMMLVKADEYIVNKYAQDKKHPLEHDLALAEMIAVASKYNMANALKKAQEMAPITTSPLDRLQRV